MERHALDPAGLLSAAQTLYIDAYTVEVVAALREAGVPSILLKGPALASLLYPEEGRNYVDADLLVAPESQGDAEAVLQKLGFVERVTDIEPPERGLPHARPWHREADGAEIDLHRTPFGVGVAPPQAWHEIVQHTEPLRLPTGEVDVLNIPGRALMVALHVAQHGDETPKPKVDLARALERVPLGVWRQAADLAGHLEAVHTLALGLGMVPGGDQLARSLHLPNPRLVAAGTRPGSSTRLALGFDRLAAEPSMRAKAAMLGRELFPTPDFLRWWLPLARRGRRGLTAAYVWRIVWLVRRAPAGYREWRRSRGPVA